MTNESCVDVFIHMYMNEWATFVCQVSYLYVWASPIRYFLSLSWVQQEERIHCYGTEGMLGVWKEARILLEQRYKRWEDAHLTQHLRAASDLEFQPWIQTVKLSTHLMAGSHFCLLQHTVEKDIGYVEELGELAE